MSALANPHRGGVQVAPPPADERYLFLILSGSDTPVTSMRWDLGRLASQVRARFQTLSQLIGFEPSTLLFE